MLIFDRANSSHRPSLGLAHKKKAGRRRRFTPAVDALELRALLSTLTVTNANDSGPGSLRQQILVAPAGSTIRFANALKGQTIVLSTGALSVNQNLDIEGPGASNLAVSGGGSSQVFDVAASTTVTIAGLTITGGVASDGVWRRRRERRQLDPPKRECHGKHGYRGRFSVEQGGGIYNAGALMLDHTSVTGNQANSSQEDASGGGIENVAGATLVIKHSVVSNNQVLTSLGTFAQGGGIDNQVGASVTIDASTISGNSAMGGPGFFFGVEGLGGAIYSAGTLTISGTTLSGNQAIGGSNSLIGGIASGGAIFLAADISVMTPPSVLTMTNSTLSNNQAIGGSSNGTGFSEGGTAQGGGITVSQGSIVTVTGSSFTNNEARGGGGGSGAAFGGAISSGDTLTFTISRSSFNGNKAVGGAGPCRI